MNWLLSVLYIYFMAFLPCEITLLLHFCFLLKLPPFCLLPLSLLLFSLLLLQSCKCSLQSKGLANRFVGGERGGGVGRGRRGRGSGRGRPLIWSASLPKLHQAAGGK